MKRSVRSMTGFGRAEMRAKHATIVVEVKSYNHRHLDLQLRVPRPYLAFESDLRALAQRFLHRGHAEIVVTRKGTTADAFQVSLNEPLLAQCVRAVAHAGKLLGNPQLSSAAAERLCTRPELLMIEEVLPQPAAERKLLLAATEQALKNLMEMRIREGASISRDISARLRTIKSSVRSLERRHRVLPQVRKRAITRRLKDAPDRKDRIPVELAALNDRCDCTEEFVRLQSHLDQLHGALALSPAGRRLDFLLQELVRELTTMNSKAQDAAAQQLVVDIKLELERIREQAQNIE